MTISKKFKAILLAGALCISANAFGMDTRAIAQHAYHVAHIVQAAAQGNVFDVWQLAQGGRAAVNVRTPSGITPLMYAAFFGRPGAARILLAADAEVNAVDNGETTALHYAAVRGTLNDGVIGANMRRELQRYQVPEEESGGYQAAMQLLLEAGARVNHQNSGGNTALMATAFCGYEEGTGCLLRYHADKNISNNAGYSALDVHDEEFFEDAIKLSCESGMRHYRGSVFAALRAREGQPRSPFFGGCVAMPARAVAVENNEDEVVAIAVEEGSAAAEERAAKRRRLE